MKDYNHAKTAPRKTSQQHPHSSEIFFKQVEGSFNARKRMEQLHNRFINLLMRNGEKSKASKLFDKSLKGLQSKAKIQNPETENFLEHGVNPSILTRSGPIENLPLPEKTNSFDFLKQTLIYQAVENVKPTLELRRVRKGGTTYQVPAIVSQKRQSRLAIKWIIESALKRKKKNKASFSDCLVKEIIEAFNKTGSSRQKRDEQLQIAEYNRAYTRYRWW